jgi:hypothetical protein
VSGNVEIQDGKVASATINADLTQLSSNQARRDRYTTMHAFRVVPRTLFVRMCRWTSSA